MHRQAGGVCASAPVEAEVHSEFRGGGEPFKSLRLPSWSEKASSAKRTLWISGDAIGSLSS